MTQNNAAAYLLALQQLQHAPEEVAAAHLLGQFQQAPMPHVPPRMQGCNKGLVRMRDAKGRMRCMRPKVNELYATGLCSSIGMNTSETKSGFRCVPSKAQLRVMCTVKGGRDCAGVNLRAPLSAPQRARSFY